jgi:hypothetical protein
MKKLVVLSVLLGLLVVAMPVVAVDLSYAGELTYGFATSADEFLETYYNYWIDVDFAADEFNTLKVEFEADPLGTLLVDWFYAYWTLDIAGVLGLDGVSAVLDTGHFRPQNNAWKSLGEYSLDRWRVRQFVDGMDLTVGYNDMVYAEVAFDGHIFDQTVDDSGLLWLGAWGTFGPASAEVFYYKRLALEEWFSVAAKGAYDVTEDIALSGNVSFGYNLMDSPAVGSEWWLGAGVKAAYADLAALAVGFNGNDNDIINGLGFELNLTPIEGAGIDAGAVFNLAEGAAESFDNLDISGWYALGATKLRVGYFMAKAIDAGVFGAMHADEAGWSRGDGSIDDPWRLSDSYIYVTADVSF